MLKRPHISSIVLAVVVVAIAVISMLLNADQPQRLQDQQRQERQAHDQSVARVVGNYDRCGKETCP